MEFIARVNDDGKFQAMFRDEASTRLFDLLAASDTIEEWKESFKDKSKSDQGTVALQYEKLCRRATHLRQCRVESGWELTFLRVVLGWLESIEDEACPVSDGMRETKLDTSDLLREFLAGNRWLNCQISYEPQLRVYEIGVLLNGNNYLFRRTENAELRVIPKGWWSYALHDMTRTDAKDCVLNHDLLGRLLSARRGNVAGHSGLDPKFRHDSFRNFSKALLEFVDEFPDLALSWRNLNPILAYVAQNEAENLGEQQMYIARIVKSKEPAQEQLSRMRNMVDAIRVEIANGSREDDQTRLATAIGTIGAHYLDRYDLDHGIEFWNYLADSDLMLRSLLHLYRFPKRYAGASASLLICLAGLAGASQYYWFRLGDISRYIWIKETALALLMVTIGLAVAPVLFVSWRFLCGRGLEYGELLFPRLLGAIAVGLSVLLLQDTAWLIGLRTELVTTGLICITAYVVSFGCIFLDVHRRLRGYPTGPDAQPFSPKTGIDSERRSAMHRSLDVSRRLFLIGLTEAFVAVLLSSTFLGEAVLSHDRIINFLREGGLALVWQMSGISLTFFPKLVMLWTGLALFIGSFLQLLWQDRQITSS